MKISTPLLIWIHKRRNFINERSFKTLDLLKIAIAAEKCNNVWKGIIECFTYCIFFILLVGLARSFCSNLSSIFLYCVWNIRCVTDSFSSMWCWYLSYRMGINIQRTIPVQTNHSEVLTALRKRPSLPCLTQKAYEQCKQDYYYSPR